MLAGFGDRIVTACRFAGCHCTVHGRTERAALACLGDVNRPPRDVGVNLHQQLVAIG